MSPATEYVRRDALIKRQTRKVVKVSEGGMSRGEEVHLERITSQTTEIRHERKQYVKRGITKVT